MELDQKELICELSDQFVQLSRLLFDSLEDKYGQHVAYSVFANIAISFITHVMMSYEDEDIRSKEFASIVKSMVHDIRLTQSSFTTDEVIANIMEKARKS